jgi:hypothetical protein
MRSCMRAHCSGNGSGVSVTRGSAKPNAVFIAGGSCARGGTSYSTSLRLRRAIRRLLDGLERVQGMVHVSVLIDEAELKGRAAYRYRPLGSTVPMSQGGQAPTWLATQAAHSKLPAARCPQPATRNPHGVQRPGSPLRRHKIATCRLSHDPNTPRAAQRRRRPVANVMPLPSSLDPVTMSKARASTGPVDSSGPEALTITQYRRGMFGHSGGENCSPMPLPALMRVIADDPKDYFILVSP